MKQVYGRKSEKVDPNPLKLFLDALAEDKAPEPPEPEPKSEPVVRQRPKPAPHGRNPLPADLPRETVVVESPESDCRCPECHSEKVVIGYEISETIDYRPGTLVVREHRREKRACLKCEEHVLPLNRQIEMFSRLGVTFSSSTLTNWVEADADVLSIVYDELVREAMNGYVLGTDDTVLKVLDRNHENGIKQGSMGVYVADDRVVVFDNTLVPENWVERQLRRVAVGRKNWLFAGSDKGAERAAVLFSVLGTCALAGAEPHAYLRDVLEQLGRKWPPDRVHELLPAAWVARRAAQGHSPAAETPPFPAA